MAGENAIRLFDLDVDELRHASLIESARPHFANLARRLHPKTTTSSLVSKIATATIQQHCDVSECGASTSYRSGGISHVRERTRYRMSA
jgi:hypothetical protein